MTSDSRAALPLLVGILAVANVLSNRVLPHWLYLPGNVVVVVVLCVVAVRLGLSREELGWQRWGRGAAFGATVAVLTVVVLGLGLAMPAFHQLYEDDRVDGRVSIMLYHVAVRIPLGTVLLEEVAFRSVVPAVAARRWGVLRGCVVASLLFGLWHVLPALGLGHVNPVFEDAFGGGAGGTAAAVVFAVTGTFVAGMWFCWLRYWSGSILSTIVAHASTNSIAYLFAWAVSR